MKTARSPPRVLRAYFECRYGQLHVTHAMPEGGGFDEATPLICIPDLDRGLGRSLLALLPLLGLDRSVYALDLPGCGMSDAANGSDPATAAAKAAEDLLHGLRIRTVDFLVVDASRRVWSETQLARPDNLRRAVWLQSQHGPTLAAAQGAALLRLPCQLEPDGGLGNAEAARLVPAVHGFLGTD